MAITLRNRGSVPSPFDTLWDLRRDFDRMFEGATGGDSPVSSSWRLATDIIETGEEIRCMVEMPGVRPEDVDLRIDNNVLTIAGEKKYVSETGDEESGHRLSERRYGRFERSFTLPRNIAADDVKAHYDDGVLTITLPKKEESRARRIEVESGSGGQRVESGSEG